MAVLLFCNVDDSKRIIDALIGEKVIPSKQYDYFFYLDDDVETVSGNVPNFLVADGRLMLESEEVV